MSSVTMDGPQTGDETFSAVLRRLMKGRRLSVARLADCSWRLRGVEPGDTTGTCGA